jgi:hypothetical protein
VNMGTCKGAHFEVFSEFSHFSFHSWSMSANLILQLVYYSFQRINVIPAWMLASHSWRRWEYQAKCVPLLPSLKHSLCELHLV